MPSQILHTLFGEDVIAALCRRLEDSQFAAGLLDVSNCAAPFALGCQGPDIFYHSQLTRPVALEYGTLLHRRGFGAFAARLLAQSLPSLPPVPRGGSPAPDPLRAYALGFMTHAALDRCCHPYIVYKAFDPAAEKGSLGENHLAHPFFERVLDVLMLKELRGLDAAQWNQEELLAAACFCPPPGLAGLLARALQEAFPGRAGQDGKLDARLGNAFADCASYYHVSAPRKTAIGRALPPGGENRAQDSSPLFAPRLLALVYPEHLPAAIDFLNRERRSWHYPYQPPGAVEPPTADTRSFPEIYAAVVTLAVDALAPCFARYFGEGVFPLEETAERLGNNCLSIQDENGKPCAPNRTSPLPLGGVLREQARMRGIAW